MIRAGWEEGVAIIRKDKESLYFPGKPSPLASIVYSLPLWPPPRPCQILTPHHSGGGRDSHHFIAASSARVAGWLTILPDDHGNIVITSPPPPPPSSRKCPPDIGGVKAVEVSPSLIMIILSSP